MEKLAILTGGGDAPGLNAVIRAAVKTAQHEYDIQMLGVRDGFDGFVEEDGIHLLHPHDVRGILPRGGTILGSANRGNPFARKVIRNGKEEIEDISEKLIKNIKDMKLDGLIVIGGDGTLRIAQEFFEKGVPVVGVPKTIDNDIGGTECTFGFDTAVNTATDAFDKLHSTAESHHRVMLLELMGRDAGFITLHAGVAGGADVILIPEIPFSFESVCKKVHQRQKLGSPFSIIAVAEGAFPKGGEPVVSIPGDSIYTARLGGISFQVAEFIAANCQVETRVTVLGHLQRGGSPSAFDRWLGTRFGAAAVNLAVSGGFGRMVALQNEKIVDLPIKEALTVPKRVDVNGDAVRAARGLGISFGE
jgi:ATP-dependent phosphofructokinase / diphosphate-dependent phosphofructokinase